MGGALCDVRFWTQTLPATRRLRETTTRVLMARLSFGHTYLSRSRIMSFAFTFCVTDPRRPAFHSLVSHFVQTPAASSAGLAHLGVRHQRGRRRRLQGRGCHARRRLAAGPLATAARPPNRWTSPWRHQPELARKVARPAQPRRPPRGPAGPAERWSTPQHRRQRAEARARAPGRLARRQRSRCRRHRRLRRSPLRMT